MKNPNIHLLLFLSLILLPTISYSQQLIEKDKLVVIGSATIEVPADRVTIIIQLSFSDKTDAKKAYEQHKDAEAQLVQFFRDSNVPDSVITYSLLSINREIDYSHQPQEKVYNTHQTVKILLTNISDYSKFELTLVSKGFVSFSENFESSKGKAAEKEAIQKAVQQARLKAELIAEAAGRKIKKVVKISDTEDTEPMIARYYESLGSSRFAMSQTTAVGLANIPQTITISKQVKAVYELSD